MDYNLTDKEKAVIAWMVEANRKGELGDEFSVTWVLGSKGGDNNQPQWYRAI